MLTNISRLYFNTILRKLDFTAQCEREAQIAQLRRLLDYASATKFGKEHDFALLADSKKLPAIKLREEYGRIVPMRDYEDIRSDVMNMIDGAPDLLWPGRCMNFAQSSGTSGGRSKYIPVTRESLSYNHYAGAAAGVALYLRSNPKSRIFSGKSFILGGSFESTLHPKDPRVRIGDLSATLISKMPVITKMMRVPGADTALLPDWEEKLDRLAIESMNANVSNISGVPSWFMRVLHRIMELKGASNIREVWPNLEVFFHGGISFEPYRNEYAAICGPEAGTEAGAEHGMRYFENYNASEGFFATQASAGPGPQPMRILTHIGIYYEFLPLGAEQTVMIEDLQIGEVYELVISGCNGLWRYRPGDTIKIEGLHPLRITMAGRTKSFINAFGEELMEGNAEAAIALASKRCNCAVTNYTAAPQYAHGKKRGHHQWLIEWEIKPEDINQFGIELDNILRELNSDYAAKRSHTIFLDPPEIITLPGGTFDNWLHQAGNGKLGGQRKITRLNNDRRIADQLLALLKG